MTGRCLYAKGRVVTPGSALGLTARQRANLGAQTDQLLGVKPIKPKEMLQLGDSDLITFDMGAAAQHFQVPRDTIAQRSRKKNPNQQDLLKEAYA